MGRQERPLDPGPLHDFANDLRKLRQETGLTYRALERKAGYSSSALSAAASGNSLCTLEVLLAYVGACGGDTAAWERRWQEMSAALSEPGSPSRDDPASAGEAAVQLPAPEQRSEAPENEANTPKQVRRESGTPLAPGRRLGIVAILTAAVVLLAVGLVVSMIHRSPGRPVSGAARTSPKQHATLPADRLPSPTAHPAPHPSSHPTRPVVVGVHSSRSAVATPHPTPKPRTTGHAIPGWSLATGGRIAAGPAVADGIVYTTSDDKYLYAVRAATGAIVNRVDIGSENDSSPVAADGHIYVGSWNNDAVYAFNANLSQLWAFRTGSAVDSTPAIAGGTVYVGSDDHNMYALNAGTGQRIWAKNLDGEINTQPAVADGLVFAGTWTADPKVGTMYALNAATGAIEWSRPAGRIDSGAVVAGPTMYFGGYDGRVWALDPRTGHVRWTFTAGGAVESTPAVADGIVYVGDDDGKLYALNAASGHQLWAFDTGEYVADRPAVAGNIVYFGSYDDHVYALNASSGTLVWEHRTGGHVESGPAIAGGAVYVGSDDGRLYALNATAG